MLTSKVGRGGKVFEGSTTSTTSTSRIRASGEVFLDSIRRKIAKQIHHRTQTHGEPELSTPRPRVESRAPVITHSASRGCPPLRQRCSMRRRHHGASRLSPREPHADTSIPPRIPLGYALTSRRCTTSLSYAFSSSPIALAPGSPPDDRPHLRKKGVALHPWQPGPGHGPILSYLSASMLKKSLK